MKKNITRIIIAVIVITIVSTIYGGLTCGWLFNWVYQLEPTNVWKPMEAPPAMFHVATLICNIIFVAIYAAINKGIPGKNKITKGFLFGLGVWALGMLPGMVATYFFMTVNSTVVVYWTIQGLIIYPVNGMIAAAIYGE